MLRFDLQDVVLSSEIFMENFENPAYAHLRMYCSGGVLIGHLLAPAIHCISNIQKCKNVPAVQLPILMIAAYCIL